MVWGQDLVLWSVFVRSTERPIIGRSDPSPSLCALLRHLCVPACQSETPETQTVKDSVTRAVKKLAG